MLNHNLRRVTDLSDAERWPKRLRDMTEEDFDAALNAHFPPTRYAPHAGLTYQGRLEERPSVQPDPGAQAASEYGNDAEDWRKASWWEDARFLLAAAAGTAGLGLVLFLFRGA